jgi:hypothetical protein
MNNDDITKSIAQSVHKIDDCEIAAPELVYFTGLINKKIKARQNSQFALFIAVSFFIVAALLLCLFADIFVFAALQAVFVMTFICVFLRTRKTGAPL